MTISTDLKTGAARRGRLIDGILTSLWLILAFGGSGLQASEQDEYTGLRGDAAAIAAAQAMVETMGGLDLWGELKSVHFVHEWDAFAL